jgi:hypothetical protein
MSAGDNYLKELKKRAKKSRVYKKYQLDGLEIAQLLKDEKHKSLYIKLAKEMNGQKLRRLAKEIAEEKNIKNKGAYFMWSLKSQKQPLIPPNKNSAKRTLSRNK